jgi:hypothetical protein
MKTLFLVLFLLSAATAIADDEGKGGHFKKTQEVTFEGSEVDGTAHTPDGAYVVQKRGISFIPLYDLKHHVNESIDSSVDYLK